MGAPPTGRRARSGLILGPLVLVGLVLVGAAPFIDSRWVEILSAYPLSANILAGFLSLPLFGVMAYLVVERAIRAENDRRWAKVRSSRENVAILRLHLLCQQAYGLYVVDDPDDTSAFGLTASQIAERMSVEMTSDASDDVVRANWTEQGWSDEQWRLAGHLARNGLRLARVRLPSLSNDDAERAAKVDEFEDAVNEWLARIAWRPGLGVESPELSFARRSRSSQSAAAVCMVLTANEYLQLLEE